MKISETGDLSAIMKRLSEIANSFVANIDPLPIIDMMCDKPHASTYIEIEGLFREAQKILTADFELLDAHLKNILEYKEVGIKYDKEENQIKKDDLEKQLTNAIQYTHDELIATADVLRQRVLNDQTSQQ